MDYPLEALRLASRDIALGRVLRERGIFRVFLIMHNKSYSSLENPDTGEPFARQEDFIKWFSETAGVSRALLFLRTAAISRLLTLGHTIEDAYRMMVRKPTVIQESIRSLGEWDGDQLVSVNPDIAERTRNQVPSRG